MNDRTASPFTRADYGTDIGPSCSCQGTIYEYQVDNPTNDDPHRYHVTARCVGCGAEFRFDYIPVRGIVNVQGIRRVHNNHASHLRDQRGRLASHKIDVTR